MPLGPNTVSRTPAAVRVEPDTPQTPAGDTPPQRCGRCQGLFDGDPTLHPSARPDWWLCPPCRIALFGPARRP